MTDPRILLSLTESRRPRPIERSLRQQEFETAQERRELQQTNLRMQNMEAEQQEAAFNADEIANRIFKENPDVEDSELYRALGWRAQGYIDKRRAMKAQDATLKLNEANAKMKEIERAEALSADMGALLFGLSRLKAEQRKTALEEAMRDRVQSGMLKQEEANEILSDDLSDAGIQEAIATNAEALKLDIEREKLVTAENIKKLELANEKLRLEKETKPSAAIQEYEYYSEQETKAGRRPMSFDAYQNMDANRRRQMVNVNLEKIREADLAAKTNATPGQIVNAATGNPVDVPETAAVRLSEIRAGIQQADVVEGLLRNLPTNAIKGYVLEKGVYWPVVQENIPPEQAEAVSEVYRLTNEYIKQISGAAVSDQEMERLRKTTPSLKLTPEANRRIIGHFKRYANSKFDEYMKLKGWKVKEDAKPAESGVIELERGPDGKLRQKQ